MKTVELFEKMFGQQNSDGSAQKWYSQPEWYCAKAYRSTQKIGSEILTFKDPLIANQWKEVSEILQRENIAEFIYGAKDPDLYLHLLELQNLGWRLKQMCVVPISPFQATHTKTPLEAHFVRGGRKAAAGNWKGKKRATRGISKNICILR